MQKKANMPIEIETIETTDQIDESKEKTNTNFQNISNRLFGENPLGGHDHDGQNSSTIDHDNLTNKGATSHSAIDQKISALPSHSGNAALHMTAGDKTSWNNVSQEVENAKVSPVYGQYLSLDARLEFIENSVAPDAHDLLTGRHVTATGSGDNSSRHKATAIWDETREQTLQESLDSIEGGFVADDRKIESGVANVDGTPTQQSFRDRYNSLLRNLPNNEIWNGTFEYNGRDDADTVDHRPTGSPVWIATFTDKYGIPGWTFESEDGVIRTRQEPIPIGEFFLEHGQVLPNCLGIMHSLPVRTSAKIISSPVILKNNIVYTFSIFFAETYNVFEYPPTFTINVKVQCSQNDGSWTDIFSKNLTTEPHATVHYSYTFTSQNYTGSTKGFHRVVITPVSTTSEDFFGIRIFKVGIFEGNLESDVHLLIPDYDSRQIAQNDKFMHGIGTPAIYNSKILNRSMLQRAYLNEDPGTDGFELSIPKAVLEYRSEVSTSYKTMRNLAKENAITETPSLTEGIATPSSTGGSLPSGTYFYTITTSNDFGESMRSESIAVTVSGGNNSGSVLLDFSQLTVVGTQINVYRGTNPSQETFIAQVPISSSWTDTGNNSSASSKMPPEMPTAYFTKYVPYYAEFSTAQDYEDGNLTHPSLIIIEPGEGVEGFLWVKTQYWPSPFDVPTWT